MAPCNADTTLGGSGNQEGVMHVACTSDCLSGRAQGSGVAAPTAEPAATSFNAVAALDAGVVVRAA